MELSLKQKRSLQREQKEIALYVIDSFATGYPVDKSLSFLLKKRKYLGSRDRRFISENIYSLFRWWGWIRQIIPRPLPISNLTDKKELELALDASEQINLLLGEKKCPLKTFSKIISRHFAIHEDKFKVEKLFPDFFADSLSGSIDKNALVEIFQKRAPIWIRTKRGKLDPVLADLDKNSIRYETYRQFPESVKIIKSEQSLYSLKTFKKGFFEVQDISSQLVTLLSFAKAGEKWLDACAGAGGKTLHLADLMNNKGSITAIDKDPHKINELKRRAGRQCFSNIRPLVEDTAKTDKKRHLFYDGVIVDAPCSCSGTWRRNPDARWRIEQNALAEFHNLQLKILSSSANYLKNGGTLLYATCSVFKIENEYVVEEFLSKNPDFSPAHFENPLDGSECRGALCVNPALFDSDSMFIAKFIRSPKYTP